MMMRTFASIAAGLIVFAAATLARAAEPPAAEPDVATMTLPQLLAEFHTRTEMTVPEPQRRIDIYNALRHTGQPLTDLLRKDLASPDAPTARNALSVLAFLGNAGRPLIPELLTVAESDNPELRAPAISVLARLRDPRSFDLIARAVHDPSARVRAAVVSDGARALADARFAVAVMALKDPDTSIRAAAITELEFLNDKRAAIYLAPLLDDDQILHNEIRDGVKTAHRNRDSVAHALEYLVNGKYLTSYTDTQDQLDARVKEWQTWSKEKAPSFDAALYVEPDLKKSLE
jgi:hypothetical protein